MCKSNTITLGYYINLGSLSEETISPHCCYIHDVLGNIFKKGCPCMCGMGLFAYSSAADGLHDTHFTMVLKQQNPHQIIPAGFSYLTALLKTSVYS